MRPCVGVRSTPAATVPTSAGLRERCPRSRSPGARPALAPPAGSVRRALGACPGLRSNWVAS
eukprot:8289524-Alexandrium_andersonii.AAC.1